MSYICLGDDITFTCGDSASPTVFSWLITSDDGSLSCVARRDGSNTPAMCGSTFSVSVSGDGSTSTLSTQSVDDTLNGTRVECVDGDVDKEICIVGKT